MFVAARASPIQVCLDRAALDALTRWATIDDGCDGWAVRFSGTSNGKEWSAEDFHSDLLLARAHVGDEWSVCIGANLPCSAQRALHCKEGDG